MGEDENCFLTDSVPWPYCPVRYFKVVYITKFLVFVLIAGKKQLREKEIQLFPSSPFCLGNTGLTLKSCTEFSSSFKCVFL